MNTKEAIERVKARFDKWALDEEDVKAIQTLIPELRGSEDERIRKWLVDYFGSIKEVVWIHRDITCEQILNYLEKQKAKEEHDRMMPIYNDRDSFESALEKAWKSYNDSGARTVDSCEDDYVECAHAKGFREGFLYGIAKQKEQEWNKKPCLTCQEYEKGFEAGRLEGCTAGYNKAMKEVEQKEHPKEELVYRLNGLMQDYIKEGKDDEEKEHRFKCYKLFWDALEDASYFEQKEQKPIQTDAEKEYVRTLKSLISDFVRANNYIERGYYQQIYDWLDGRHIEQKPAEWSEEDEEMLNNIEYILHKDISYTPPTKPNSCTGSGNAYYTHQTEIDWLKSFRPQYHGDVTMTEAYKMGLEAGKASSWKPSEHQMSILKAVKEYVGKGSGYWGEGLGSLIDDLEKLM